MAAVIKKPKAFSPPSKSDKTADTKDKVTDKAALVPATPKKKPQPKAAPTPAPKIATPPASSAVPAQDVSVGAKATFNSKKGQICVVLDIPMELSFELNKRYGILCCCVLTCSSAEPAAKKAILKEAPSCVVVFPCCGCGCCETHIVSCH